MNSAKLSEGEKMKSKLRNTLNCFSNLQRYEDRVYGKRCKNRFCSFCINIRTAEIINCYLPALEKWNKLHFVTLTLKSVNEADLNPRVKKAFCVLERILSRYRKRSNRSMKIVFKAVKSFEINYNPKRNTYNPHFHFLIENRQMAYRLIEDWKKEWGSEFVNIGGQDIKPVNNRKDIISCLKYITKVFKIVELPDKMNNEDDIMIYSTAYLNIINSIENRKIFSRYGFKKIEDETEISFVPTSNYERLQYDSKEHDYISVETQESLLENI